MPQNIELAPAWWATWLVCRLNLACSISSRVIFITFCTKVNSKQMRYRSPDGLLFSYSGKFIPSSLTQSMGVSIATNMSGLECSLSSLICSISALCIVFGVLCSADRPHSQRQSCQCVTLRTRRHVTRRLLAGRLGTSNCKLFRRPLLLPSCCGCVLNCSRFLCVWKILKSFPSQISSICSR